MYVYICTILHSTCMWYLGDCFVFSAAVDDDHQQDIKMEDKSRTETPPDQRSVRDSKDSEQAENPPSPTLPTSSPATSSLLPSTPLSPSLTLLTLPPAPPEPVSPTSESAKELAHRSATDIAVPKSPSKPQLFTSSRRRSSTSQGSSVNTRFRAQTAFENVSLCLIMYSIYTES